MTQAVRSPRQIGLIRRLPWRWLRRAAQLAVVIAFFWLFRRTESTGTDTLAEPVSIFFRIDPLVGASAMLGAKQFLSAFWPAIGVLALTVLLGRFFCGWFCPLGTLLDWFHRPLRPIAQRTSRFAGTWPQRLRPLRYVLLVLVLMFAVFGLPLVGYLDPFALLVRGTTFWGDPAMFRGVTSAVTAAESSEHWRNTVDRVYPFLRDHVLPFGNRVFVLSGIAIVMLVSIFALEFVKRRFWCRYLCPLGAMVGVASRFSPLRRVPVKSCPTCPAAATCGATCRMDAFATDGTFKADDCNLCMDCVADCPESRTSFQFKRRKSAPQPIDLSRRAALLTIAAGVATPALVKAGRIGRSTTTDPQLIRPPGVSNERGFLDLCIRCGLCMKVCTTNALQPTGLMSGIEGIFSPRLVPRMGYCEVSCTLCGQVCPTGAIPLLDPKAKATFVMGKAVFDLDRCLPWAKNEECICCEEHCPVAEKAIRFDEVQVTNDQGERITLKRPYVHMPLCTGCGICENKCPLDGEAAIHVRREESVPKGEGRGQGRGAGHGRGGGGRGGGRGRRDELLEEPQP